MNDPRPDPLTNSRRSDTPDDENPVDLLRQLTNQGAHLAQEEVSLMQAEVREAVNDLKKAIGAMAGAAIVGLAGLVVFLMALAYLLGDAIEDVGLGTLIVGIATLILGAILFFSGKKKIEASNLTPERTIRTVEDTPDAATGNMPNTRRNP